jgi:3alpha(or 20beta)-hydroxysteroid dehydrogenase
MAGRLDRRVALISGGARGQGAAHARRLAEEGAVVIAGDVLDAEGAATAAMLRADGLDVDYLHLDVTSPADWTQAVGYAVERSGGLDVLVNNAGIARR